ncbi:MAG TPA: sporulation integral membrane protein YlbJ [Bacillota bacterium]|jgi:sporulation integral membrane protein YlbJ
MRSGAGASVRGRPWGATLAGLLTLILTLTLVFYAEEGYHAAADGLKLFLNVVFPSLLPFFVLSEIMLGMGVVHFMGVVFEPLMRPLFNVPGIGSFVLSMGLAAGYPMDAVITAKFRANKMCTRIEGERLLAFTNTADPLFIFGAVAVGMFGMPRLGYAMAAAHYLSALCVGLCYRFYGLRAERRGPGKAAGGTSLPSEGRAGEGGFMLVRAAKALYRARREDGRSLGKMLGDAVTESIQTLLMICGFIMLFSVVIKVLAAVGAVAAVAHFLSPALTLFGISQDLVSAMLSGLFEIDVGTVAASVANAPFLQKVAVASAIIAWSGLSVHGQVMNVLSGTDIRMGAYMFARLLHALFAATFTILFLGPAAPAIDIIARPAFSRLAFAPLLGLGSGFWRAFGLGFQLFAVSLGIMALAGLGLVVAENWRRLRVRVIR